MDIVETIGGEILEALKKDAGGWGYVGKGEELSATVLDGDFDLTKVARAAIRATLCYYMENVSEEAIVKMAGVYQSERHGDIFNSRQAVSAIRRTALTQALKELDRAEALQELALIDRDLL